METNARHVLIGAFVIGMVLVGLGFLRWSVQGGLSAQSVAYRVQFAGGVSGLMPGANVLFNGIKVGAVDEVGIDRQDTRNVSVVLRVDDGTPVRVDSLASITQAGITGLSAIQISPGDPRSPLLVSSEPQVLAEIKAKPALAGSMMDAMPEILANVNALFVRLNEIVAGNEGALRQSLASFQSFTSVLDENKNELATTLTNVRKITDSFASSAAQLDGIISKIDGNLLEGDSSILVQAREALAALRNAANSLDKAIGADAGPIAISARRGLQEFEMLAKEGRRAVRSLDRVLERVDRNPQSLLFGETTVREYKPN